MDGAQLEIVCLCGGSENFERVIVLRKPPPIFIDFVACVACRAMYFAPVPTRDRPEPPPGHGVGMCGGPQLDSDEKLKRDVQEGWAGLPQAGAGAMHCVTARSDGDGDIGRSLLPTAILLPHTGAHH